MLRQKIYLGFLGLLLTSALRFTPQLQAQINSSAQNPSSSSTSASAGEISTEQDLLVQISSAVELVNKDIEALRKQLEVIPQNSAELPFISRRLELLQHLEILYSQQKTALERGEELKQKKITLLKEDESFRSDLLQKDFYPFLVLEGYRNQLVDAETESERIAASVSDATRAVDESKKLFEDRDSKRRLAVEAALRAKGSPESTNAEQDSEISRLECKTAEEFVKLRTLEASNEKLSEELHTQRLQSLRERIKLLSPKVSFSKDQLEAKLKDLDSLADELTKKLETARLSLEKEESKWSAAQKAVAGAEQATEEDSEREQEKLLIVQTPKAEIASLAERLQLIAGIKVIWQRRFEAINAAADAARYASWAKESKSYLDALARQTRLNLSRQEDLRKEFLEIEEQLSPGHSLEKERVNILRSEQRQIQKRIAFYESALGSIDELKRLNLKLLEELQLHLEKMSWATLFSNIAADISSVWNYELLTTADDRPLTVKKIVVSLILLFLGFILSRIISRTFSRKVLPKFKLNLGAQAAIQSLIFYSLLIFFTIFALHLANVPLTIFTVLGGAIAIGVGFGSQTIMNNFISGLILLIEQPIRVGDLIEVDGLRGRVRRVGARSTHVQTGNNIDILVPNSLFLERNVINWTLSDDRVLVSVRVGVSYDADPAQVIELLLKAVNEHPQVLAWPTPTALLLDFAESSLDFSVNFSIHLGSLIATTAIESDIRLKILALFRENQIVISFPQRDLHLYPSSDALPVRMVDSKEQDL